MKHPAATLFLGALLAAALPYAVASADSLPIEPESSYADLATLADGTPLVIRAEVRSVAPVEAARAPGLKPGRVRLYVEARTQTLIAGNAALGEALRYLVDVPLGANGKPPKLKKQVVLLFARSVPDRPGELQLADPQAQLAWSPALETRVKSLLGELYAAGAPRRVTGVREAIHVAGALAGEGETQLFLATADAQPAAITVTRRPGFAPIWRVSFSELVGAAAAPPSDTLAWYRLACSLPPQLPATAHVSPDTEDRIAAASDYRFVLDQLGPCTHTR